MEAMECIFKGECENQFPQKTQKKKGDRYWDIKEREKKKVGNEKSRMK